MRPLPALILAASATLAAQDAWTAYLEQRQALDPARTPWGLILHPASATNEAPDDPLELLPWRLDRDFAPLNPSAEARAALARSKGWGTEPRWLLLNPAGDPTTEGRGQPTAEDLRSAFHTAGYVPRATLRERFLAEHPDQGEVLGEAAFSALMGAMSRVLTNPALRDPADPLTPADQAAWEQAFGPTLEPLTRLAQQPRWWQASRRIFWSWMPHVSGLEGAAHVALQGRMARDFAQAWQKEPQALALHAENFEGLARWDISGLAANLEPVPGPAWPPRRLLMHWGDSPATGDLPRSLQPRPPLPPVSEEAWGTYRLVEAEAAFQRARKHRAAGQLDEARNALREARRWAASEQEDRRFQSRLTRDAKDNPSLGEAFPEVWLDPTPEPPPPPRHEPLRLVLRGPQNGMQALALHPALAPWGPEDLQWVREPGAEPGWAIFKGDTLLASGSEPPDPRHLAIQLTAGGPTRLQRLDALLARQPDHLDARRERARLLLARMPHPALEPVLAEDARLGQVALDFGPEAPWQPDPALWQTAALKVLPELERLLRTWPSDADLWRRWVAWSAFHPRRPSPLALAQELPLPPWASESQWRARLPKEVHGAVAQELRQRGRYEDLRAWFQSAVEGLDARPLRNDQGRIRPWLQRARREEIQTLIQPLREALLVLRRDAELLALERRWAELSGEALPARPQ